MTRLLTSIEGTAIATTTEPETNRTPRAALTAEFCDEMKTGVAGIIGAGRVLIKGKEQLENGEFTDWVVKDLKFGTGKRKVDLRKAELYMAIAEHEVLRESCHWHALPPSPRTLYELTLIRPKSRLLKLLAEGKISSATTREEAIALKGGRAQPRPAFIVSAAIAHLQRQLDKLSDAEAVHNLRDDAGSLTPDLLKQFARRLTALAKLWAD
jgi:hypothetical protein